MAFDQRKGSVLVMVAMLAAARLVYGQTGVPDPSVSSAKASPFRGLAQAPEANLFAGSATTSIPIEVPPGRKGLMPQLRLVYNSASGPSPYGHGWQLPLGAITRSRKHGVLSCNDALARRQMVVSLPQGEIECTLAASAVDGWQRCTAAIEEAFLRIDYHPQSNRWLVRDKGGLVYGFGEADHARSGAVTATGWVDGDPCRYTHSWSLTSILDPHGNRVDLQYERVGGVSYAATILYGGNPEQGLAHAFQVRFVWGGRAPLDQPLNSSGGFPARLTRLLRSIEVSYPIDAAPVRSYRFGYDFDSAATQRPGRSSFLTAVTLYGRNGLALARADGLPASTTFRYHEVRSEDRKLEGASLSWPSGVRALRYEKGKEHRDLHIDLRDMNGDGILDLVDTTRCSANNRRWDVYLGSAAGYGGEALPWHTIDTSWACHLSNVDVDGNDADTDHDAIDLNGDGLPDLVDARQQPWQVYFGRPPGAGHGWGFDPSAASWAATVTTWFEQPVYALRATDGGDGWVDVVDWNGDGLPDLLNARSGRVHHNTGSGFDPLGTAVSFPNHRLRYGSEHHVREGLFDLNGDSLPDLVRAADDASTWQVYFHQGAQLATTAETWQAPIDCADGITSIEGGDTTNRDLFDINGDGLLDLVESCHWSTQSPYWQVRLNHGSGFAAQAIAWRSPLRWIRYENDCLEPGERCVFYQMIDGDGDALADLVDGGDRWLKPSSYWIHRNGAGAWRQGCDGACVNPDGGRAELLVQIQNGIGGITDLRYRPSTDWDNSDVDGVPQLPMVLWNVVEITQRSDMAEVVPGASTLSTTMRYAYGKFDAAMREFRGFGTVYTADGGGTQTATVFKQDAARKGKIEQVRIYAAGADPESDIPLEASLNQWSCADPITGVRLSCAESLLPGERRWPRLEASHRYTYNANGIDDLLYKHSVAENLAWDAYGNITRVRQSGDNATPAIETATEYAAVDTAAAYLVDRPAHVSIASGDTVSEKWFMYDGLPLAQVSRGNLTREEIWLDHPSPGASGCAAASGQMCAASVFEHDGLGNVVQVRDALGRTTRIEHDSLGLYPIRATNPLGHVVRSEYDPACGKQTMQTLPNATAHHRRVYDEHCRLSQTYLPGQTTPERRIHYYLGGRGVATDIFTETAETASPTGWNEADELFDSLGRPVQRLRSATVDGYRTLVADNTVAYDERGEVVRVHSAFTTSYAFGPGGIVLYRAAPAGADTTLERDALGRVTRIRHPDGSERRTDHTTAWQTATTDECYHSGTCPGGRTVEVVDAAGRVIEKRSYERSGASETLKAGMKYAYDGAGRVINTTQWDGARWAPATRITLRYDSMGRKIEKQDPDSGTWRYGYDLAGNLLFEDDPQTDQHVQFCYDAGDRVVSKYVFRDRDWQDVGSACGSAEVAETTYTYDGSGPNEIGRLIRVDDGSGTTFLERYDEQGRARSVTRELIVANHRERATMTYDYDRAGHLRAIGYPDGEMALYEYDESGQVQAVRSSDS
ncbi:MAG TPA: toxin TcdB middle/N-terminal domain-containing protein, partial [Terriglobales bacterium]|nr:toxin TcdB middle/N-terminal domain-containing protein [Terriglobales bacterium]